MAEAARGSLHPSGLTTMYPKLLFSSKVELGSWAEGRVDSLHILPPQYREEPNHRLAVAHHPCGNADGLIIFCIYNLNPQNMKEYVFARVYTKAMV